jgi:anhydro-N-acetylmuramic acid kinase
MKNTIATRNRSSNQIHKILGIMSGTSADGVDYALCEIKSSGAARAPAMKLKGLWSVSFPAELRKRILAAASNSLSTYETAQLHHDLGRFYAKHAPKVKCDYIGLHGQTVYHNPSKASPSTYQIGEPAYLAARFNVPVVNQFRTMDLALGGQGAPLATAFHREIFSLKNKNVAVNNLGGISNATFLPASKSAAASTRQSKILSFDTGPANMLIDYAVAKMTHGRASYDKNGECCSRGIPRQALVEKWRKS